MKSRVLEPWRPGPGEWDRGAAAHLFRRAGFGASVKRIDRAVAEGLEASLAAALANAEPDARLEQGIEALLPTGSTASLQAWWMSLVLSGDAPLRERVALMWHDHFATSDDKVDDARSMHRQNALLREKGLGDFRELLHAVAKDPAMLVWLDGDLNKRGQANENFAREIMELFALGIGSYTEKDVLEAARAFTGWGTRGRAFVFREGDHDPGTKEIFGRRGAWRGEDAVQLVLDHPRCPHHVARRLLEELVAPAPEAAWIEETAEVLVRNAWDIGRTIAALLRSELFFRPSVRRSRIAAPVELIAATAQACQARVAPRWAAEAAGRMGQALFRPPSVKGWDGMRSWINAGTWVARHNALTSFASPRETDGGPVRTDLREAFGEPRTKAEVPALVTRALLPGARADWDGGVLQAAARDAADVDGALARVTALVLTAPEYHLF